MAFTTYETEEQEKISSYRNDRQVGVLDNQLDFNNASMYQPSYSSNYIEETEEEEQNSPVFEVEKEYKMQDEIGGDVTIVPTFMPTIHKNEEVTQNKSQELKFKLNARGKIIVSVFSIISILLLSFCIYNAVLIGSLKSTIADKQIEAELLNREVYDATIDYNNITSTNSILAQLPAGYTDGADKIVEVSLNQQPNINIVEAPSNWFDKLCNFLSNLFN